VAHSSTLPSAPRRLPKVSWAGSSFSADLMDRQAFSDVPSGSAKRKVIAPDAGSGSMSGSTATAAVIRAASEAARSAEDVSAIPPLPLGHLKHF
jgi:hypothetical protein